MYLQYLYTITGFGPKIHRISITYRDINNGFINSYAVTFDLDLESENLKLAGIIFETFA